MKSITIHGIDTDLDKKISKKAAEFGLSQNRTVKLILQSSFTSDKTAAKRESFADLFGKWTIKEKEDFDEKIKDLDSINEVDWQK